MQKSCNNCSQSFTIEPDDVSFYERIKVPSPTWCPECRVMRRYAWRNDRNLYRRPCDLCGKSTVAMYSSNKPFKVYCQACWWSDKWDASGFGRDYDPSRPFFEQFAELQRIVPRIAMLGKNSVRSEYTNHSSDNKDCFMGSSVMNCEDVLYADFVLKSRDSLDCTNVYMKAERCYQCINIDNSYQCQYCILCNNCSNCMYCYDLRGCTDCFLSVNLRNKSNYFLNQPYSKEEYKKKVEEFNFGSHADRQKLYQQFLAIMRARAIHKYTVAERAIGSTGSYVFDSKNAHYAFDVSDCEDVKFVANVEEGKDVMDSYRNAVKIELIYECHALIRTYDLKFCNLTYDVSHLEYCDNCFNSQNLFGCVGLKKGEYMILNKRYSPEDYKELVRKIKIQMTNDKEYGEFFPMSLSPFDLNESHVALFMPEKVQEKLIMGTFGKETLHPEQIPDDIKDIQDDITKQALKCTTCNRNYNIVEPELAFYRREIIPIPRQCYPCRDAARIALRAPRKLYHRTCMKEGCPTEFETPYAPDRPEKIYCETHYNAEIL